MTLLNVDQLTVAYQQADGGWLETVKQASFQLRPGACLGIVGESGSGKSTLARALMGYCRNGGSILGGTVRLDTQTIVPAAPDARNPFRGLGMAYVPQNPLSSLTPHCRVGDQVSEAVRCNQRVSRAAAKAHTLELFKATGLPAPEQLYQRYPHQLSGGQRQRVVIAAALAAQPRLLILDEPTTALDKTTEKQVLELIQQLRDRFNTALIYVSHDLNVIARMCDDVLVMRHGRIVEQGPTTQLYQSPRHAYTRALLAAMPAVDPSRCAAPASPRPASDSLLQVEALRFSYQRPASWMSRLGLAGQAARPAVQSLSFRIPRGETLGLVGESGSGKSTVAALVAGLYAPDGGELRFDGVTLPAGLKARSQAQRRRIQVVFQDPLSSLNPRHRVADILIRPLTLFFGLNNTLARRRVLELMEALHLDPALLERYPRQLSGGQQQRVAIARAFAAEPELIICDEITSALDASVQAQVLRTLRELQASTGVTLLFISHDLGVVQQMAQSVLVLRHGAVQAYGRTEDIFRHPPNDYTRLLLEASAAPVFSSGHGNRAKPAASTDSDILLFSSRTALHETPSPHRSAPRSEGRIATRA
ncbi:MAG: ABC transporter ATP-binding protein [Pigmentiphaga sp.]|nr:ABC transporter ATP-binding protein [Pigmentiphaga sp.]